MSSAVEFAQNIGSQTQECRSQVDVRVSDTSILSIGCVDPKTSFGTWNVPGGMLLLWWENEEAFEDFFRHRSGMSGTFYVHLCCGYLFCELGLKTLDAQKNLITYFTEDVDKMNSKYGCSFDVVVEEDGSAKVHMNA